jgi:hypothetical protein
LIVSWVPGPTHRLQIGKITRTFDLMPVSRNHPYPWGYSHDLSLVTRDTIMHRTHQPQGEHLRSPVGGTHRKFCMVVLPLQRTCTLCLDALGFSMEQLPSQLRKAIAKGSHYIWDRKCAKLGVSVLWRTVYDRDKLDGKSGSVLCSGLLEDRRLGWCVFRTNDQLGSDKRGAPGETLTGRSAKGGFCYQQEFSSSRS